MAVEARVRDETRKLEDRIETQASAQFLLQSQIHGTLSLNLNHLRHDIDCFVQLSKKMSEEYMEELYKPPPPAAFVDVLSSDSGEPDCDNMVGLSDLFFEIRDRIVADHRTVNKFTDDVNVVAITGTGKTALVKKLYNDSLVKEKFECRAFVRVGKMFQLEGILRAIIAQVNLDRDDEMIMEEGESIYYNFRKSLGFRRFLIVLDDVWDKDFREYFTTLLTDTDIVNGYVLVTSRIDQVFYYERSKTYYHYRMQLLNDEESWELLQRKVFGDGGDYYCSPLLVKAGKKIAENCEGLPLLILTVAKLLSKAPKTPEYWTEVAEMKNPVSRRLMQLMPSIVLIIYPALKTYLHSVVSS